jgi:hypothetical protein
MASLCYPLLQLTSLDFDLAGDLMHIRVFGMHIIIIHTMEIANELFEKRSQIYSSRPGIPMADLSVAHKNFDYG